MEDHAGIVIRNILTRTSIRDFTDRPVEKDVLDLLLQAAMAAPSARNRQPWAFVVVTERTLLDRLAEGLPRTKMLFNAAAAIVVCGDSATPLEEGAIDLWYMDASAATQNILLAAHGTGLGAVWSAMYPYPDRMSHVSQVLGLADEIIPFSVVPLGYPSTHANPKNKFKREKIHLERW
jgi:nitroreductase